jgi:predicted oxidoreductase
MFRHFKEKNKNLLRLKLKSAFKIEQIPLLTLKKKIMDTGVLHFFNKKLILNYYFCLKSGPVFLIIIFA